MLPTKFVSPLLFRQISFGQAQFRAIIVNPIKPILDRDRLVCIGARSVTPARAMPTASNNLHPKFFDTVWGLDGVLVTLLPT